MAEAIRKFVLEREKVTIDIGESLRYLGYRKDAVTEQDIGLVERFVPKVLENCSPVACYGRYPINVKEKDTILLPYGEVKSKDLGKNLAGCREIYIFAATIGAGFDRLIQRTKCLSLADAAIMQAIGATAVENVCDRLNERLKEEAKAEGKKLRPRYSPGYGDYTLENQKEIFKLLEPHRYAGITLTDSLLMVPEKSVTAVIGIE